jgi:membrane protein
MHRCPRVRQSVREPERAVEVVRCDQVTGSSEPPAEPSLVNEVTLKPLRRLARRNDFVGRVARSLSGSFLIACLGRFVKINGRDRILSLAGQSFIAVVPAIIVVSSLSSNPDALSDRLIERLGLTGSAADAVHELFAQPTNSPGAVTFLGLLILFFSFLSFMRALQRTYESAWELPPVGLRGTLHGLSSVVIFAVLLVALGLLGTLSRSIPAGSVLTLPLKVVVSAVLWLQLQRMLLSRRVSRRQLRPGAVVAGLMQVVTSVYAATYLPHLVSTDAERYGVIGVTFALLTWLIVIAAGMVAIAVVSAEAGFRQRARLAGQAQLGELLAE